MSQLQLHQLSPHVHWMAPDSTTDRPILGAVAGAHGTFVVDTGNSAAHARMFLKAIADHDLAPPAFAMMTHWHWDHVFGSATIDLPTFAHPETQRIVTLLSQLDWSDAALDQRVADGREIAFCRDMIKAELPDRSHLVIRPPEIAFPAEVIINLGGVSCHLVHVGGDHAHDSSVVYIPEDKVMFLGDCIYDDLHHGPRRLTTTQLFPLLDRLLGYDVDYYLPAHHTEPLSYAQMAEERRLLTVIGHTVEEHGTDRERTLERLPAVLGTTITDDHIEIVDAFIAGLRLPVVQSIL